MIYVVVAAVLVPVVLLAIASATAKRPDNLGVRASRLASCPQSPNCVCTQCDDEHRIAPIPFEGEPAQAMAKIKRAFAALPRSTIVTETPDYLHVEVRSLLFRFVDDVEFFVDTSVGLIHFRSASRVGQSDLGVNRARMEALRKAMASP